MGWMSAICDAHKTKVHVELFYTQCSGNSFSWRKDVVEKARTQQSSPGERERDADGHKSGGQYVAVLLGL